MRRYIVVSPFQRSSPLVTCICPTHTPWGKSATKPSAASRPHVISEGQRNKDKELIAWVPGAVFSALVRLRSSATSKEEEQHLDPGAGQWGSSLPHTSTILPCRCGATVRLRRGKGKICWQQETTPSCVWSGLAGLYESLRGWIGKRGDRLPLPQLTLHLNQLCFPASNPA